MDCGLPHWQTTVRALASLYVRCSGKQHQGTTRDCPLSFLFTLYTTDLSYQIGSCHLLNFSDDAAVVGCISKGVEAEYRTVMENFVTWCELNHLQVNTTNTKQQVVDLRRAKTPVTTFSIVGDDVDIIEDYKYLGVYVNKNWTGLRKLKHSTRRERAAPIF